MPLTQPCLLSQLSTKYYISRIYLLFPLPSHPRNPKKRRRRKLSPPCVVDKEEEKKELQRVPKRASLERNQRTAWRLNTVCTCIFLTCWPPYTLPYPFSQLYSLRDFCLHCCNMWFQETEEQMSTCTWEACWTCVWQQQTFHCISHRNTQFPLPVSENTKMTSGTKDTSNRSQQKAHCFWLSWKLFKTAVTLKVITTFNMT